MSLFFFFYLQLFFFSLENSPGAPQHLLWLHISLVFSSSEARRAWKMSGAPMAGWIPGVLAFSHVSRTQHPDSREGWRAGD